MWEKMRNRLYQLSDIVEFVMGIAVIVAVIIAIIGLKGEYITLWNNRGELGSLIVFLEYIFNIVIGIEFLKMLCKPRADIIIEVLLFLVARHMIIGKTTAIEDLLSIISMAILFLIKSFIVVPAKREGLSAFFGGKKRAAASEEPEQTEE